MAILLLERLLIKPRGTLQKFLKIVKQTTWQKVIFISITSGDVITGANGLGHVRGEAITLELYTKNKGPL